MYMYGVCVWSVSWCVHMYGSEAVCIGCEVVYMCMGCAVHECMECEGCMWCERCVYLWVLRGHVCVWAVLSLCVSG